MLALALIAFGAALLPVVLVIVNLRHLRTPEPVTKQAELVSILIPARNEEANIGQALAAALASTGVPIEVVVGDDASTDRTAEIVREAAARDPRCRLEPMAPLQPGWTGKTHACAQLAPLARGRWLLFADADVRLEPEGAARLQGHARRTGSDFVSGVPRQIMGSLGERLTVPMINFLMLGFLPVPIMRQRPDPSLGAACGQLLFFAREAYERSGGHGAVRTSLHDGLTLARHLRGEGFRCDLVPGHRLARCRMYCGFAQSWSGFSRNAREGMARPLALPVWTLLLACGQVLPWIVLAWALLAGASWPVLLVATAACGLSLIARTLVTLATREPPMTIALHPLGICVVLALQWNALLRGGRSRVVWRDRSYGAQ